MNKVHTYKTPQYSQWLIVVLEDQRMDLEVTETSITMPIIVDNIYNLITCKDCCIGLPFEWVPSHLQEHHGIRVTSEWVMAFLDLEEDAMTVTGAKDWISSVWVGRAVQSIPVIKGYGCHKCQYSAATVRVMENHFSEEHKGLKSADHSTECKVQLVFKSGLRKYIQIEEEEESDVDSGSDCEWEKAIEMDFEKSMANVKTSGGNGNGNLRLMNVFIAKTRRDVMVEGRDLKEIVTIAGRPPSNQNLHKIILCGRRYIKKICEALNKASVIIKRWLMSEGYAICGRIR
jgi:hypothetical protein